MNDAGLLKYTLLFFLTICSFSHLSADSAKNSNTHQQLYFYIPVSFWPNSDKIERYLSKSVYQQTGVQLLHSPGGYHVSMGNYLMPSTESAKDIAFRIQRLVRRDFSKFTAQVDNKHEGVTIFGKFVVIVLKTDKKKGNKQRNLFRVIHKKITKLILAAGGSQIGFQEFRPHCSIASVMDTTALDFLQIRRSLLKNLSHPASKIHLVVNPKILQYRVNKKGIQ